MKIGIVTYWESNDNYGQQLQCWALQHFLREKGYDAFLIRQYVWPPAKKKGIKRLKQRIKDVIALMLYDTGLAYVPRFAKYFAFCLDREACRRKFPQFRKENLKMTKIFNQPEELVNHPPKADIYITGSDQVWNYSMPRGPLKNFFLQFGDKHTKRIAYAPSIGHSEFPKDMLEDIKTYLRDFSALSVRESSAMDVIRELGYNSIHVVDPTMLLPLCDYMRLVPEMVTRKSVYIYSINYESKTDIPFDNLQYYAKQKGLPIIVTPGSGYVPGKELFDGVEYSYATIPQWLSHIARAELVVTASFHGIVMSILMHKPFIYTPLKGRLATSNNRVINLLESLTLTNQIYSDEKQMACYFEISWQKVDKKIDDLRRKSCDFLITNLI